MRNYLTVAVALAIAAPWASAQREAKDDAQWVSECRNQDRWHDHARYCEVRVDHLASVAGPLDVDARENGGVEIIGGATNDIVVHELVEAEAPSEADAKDMTAQIHVTTSGGRIHAGGPPDHGLETGTVNGPMSIGFPITVSGHLDVKRLSIDVNGGGPTIRVVTTNGPVTVDH